MTIHEAKQGLSDLAFKGFSKQDVFKLVDKIYDELETKSCEGCIYLIRKNSNGNVPLSCGECSRFYSDNYEEIKK